MSCSLFLRKRLAYRPRNAFPGLEFTRPRQSDIEQLARIEDAVGIEHALDLPHQRDLRASCAPTPGRASSAGPRRARPRCCRRGACSTSHSMLRDAAAFARRSRAISMASGRSTLMCRLPSPMWPYQTTSKSGYSRCEQGLHVGHERHHARDAHGDVVLVRRARRHRLGDALAQVPQVGGLRLALRHHAVDRPALARPPARTPPARPRCRPRPGASYSTST